MRRLQNRIASNLCKHGYTFNFCPERCVQIKYWDEVVKDERSRIKNLFTKRELKNPVTRESFIRKLHDLHTMEQFVQVPDNFIRNLSHCDWKKGLIGK